MPTKTKKSYPVVGATFELTMPNDSDGQQMVKDFGYGDDWPFKGKKVKKGVTQSFKLVQVGYQENLKAVAKACAEHGEIPNGVWLQVFADTFKNNGEGPVGVADASWEDPDGDAVFPMVRSDGDRDFRWADSIRHERWRWLVAVSKISGSSAPSDLLSRLESLESDMERLKEIINL
jgi:hypothetical protein